jgi:hypothetical protein
MMNLPTNSWLLICDFCSERNPTRVFNTPDFQMDEGHPEAGLQPMESRGAWMACSTCGTYIDAGEWERLALRAVDRHAQKYGAVLPRRIIFDQVKRAHDLFRAHYEVKKS